MKSIDRRRHAHRIDSAFIVSLEGEFDIADRECLADGFAIASNAQLVIVDLEKRTISTQRFWSAS